MRFIGSKSEAHHKLLHQITRITGLKPGNTKMYELAFIHRSASIHLPNGEIINNERLEYLGDAIIDAVVSDYLFRYFPGKDEGFLSKVRSRIVKRKNLNWLAEKIGIPSMLVSHTEHNNGIKHIYGDALEALIGAIYLDKGYVKTRKFIVNRLIKKHVDMDTLINLESDFKSRVIEWAQKERKDICFESQEIYQDHAKVPVFISHIKLGDVCLGEGTGTSKKEAEQSAAEIAFYQYLEFH